MEPNPLLMSWNDGQHDWPRKQVSVIRSRKIESQMFPSIVSEEESINGNS